jgi:predicted DNA-binding transcriptional regulator YafY
MKDSSHETLVYRLSQILLKLNQGEKLDARTLSEEFGVSLRTIQRDLNIRFGYLPLEKTRGLYHLDPIYLGKLTRQDIARFASLAGVKGLFPSLGDDFFREIFDQTAESALLVKGHNFEDVSGKSVLFKQIKNAIDSKSKIQFLYMANDNEKLHDKVEPYRLLNHHGIWYLAGIDKSTLKTFALSNISGVKTLDSNYSPDHKIQQQIDSEEGIWFSKQKIKVVLQVAPTVANYFKRRKLIANQSIDKALPDGGLIISASVGHKNQILPIVKYWIPHIKILGPKYLQNELKQSLDKYIKGI